MPIKDSEKNKSLTNGHQIKYTYYFTICYYNNAVGFYFMISPQKSKILCNSKYSIRIILQFSCMCFMRYDMEITWKLFISLKNLICIWVSEFVHKEFAYSQRSVMSVFSPVHSLIHPLFLLSTCILWAS